LYYKKTKKKGMKRQLLMMLYLIGMAASVQAQNISGKLVDEQEQPLAYANIVLLQADSTFITGQTSDEKGGFHFSKVTEGDYRLKISSMGYETMFIDDVARMVLVTASWNFSFGRDYKSKNKRMNNSDSDSGVM
jgi:hypothetical protein